MVGKPQPDNEYENIKENINKCRVITMACYKNMYLQLLLVDFEIPIQVWEEMLVRAIFAGEGGG